MLARTARAVLDSPEPPDFLFGDSLDMTAEGATFFRSARSPSTRWLGMFALHQAMFFGRRRLKGMRYRLEFRIAADYALVSEFLDLRHPVGPGRVRRLDFAVCLFALGGIHFQRRSEALREDFIVRRRFQRQNLPAASLLFAGHWIHNCLKK